MEKNMNEKNEKTNGEGLEELESQIAANHPELKVFTPFYILAHLIIGEGLAGEFINLAIQRDGLGGLIVPKVFNGDSDATFVIDNDKFQTLCKVYLAKCIDIASQFANFPRRQQWSLDYVLIGSIQQKIPDAVTVRTWPKPSTVEELKNLATEPENYFLFPPHGTLRFNREGSVCDVNLNKTSDQDNQLFAMSAISRAVLTNPEAYLVDESILDLINQFAKPKTGDYIYDPNCSVGLLATGLAERNPDLKLRFSGICENSVDYFLATANFVANQIIGDLEVQSDLGSSESIQGLLDEPPFDLAISILPHRMTVKGRGLDRALFPFGSKMARIEYAYVELILSVLNESGRAVIVVSDMFLSSSEGKAFRQKLTREDLIERVHYLGQSKSSATMVNQAIVVLNKKKEKPGFVTFDGEGHGFSTSLVQTQEIADNSFSWHPRRYASKQRMAFNDFLLTYQNHIPIRKLKDLVEYANSGGAAAAKYRVEPGIDGAVPYVTISDLLPSDSGGQFDPRSAKTWVNRETANSIVDYSAILVGTIKGSLKPTLFDFKGFSISIGHGVVALRPNNLVREDYLLAQLQSGFVKSQIEMMSSGNIISRISKSDLLNVELPLPTSLTEQQQRADELLLVAAEKADVIDQLVEAKEEARLTEYDVIAAISHNLNQKLGSMVEDVDSLLRFLKREASDKNFDFDKTLRPIRAGEDSASVETFAQVADRLEQNLSDTATSLKTTEDILQKRTADLHLVNLVRFFKEEIQPKFQSPLLRVTVETSKSRITVPLDKMAFTIAIRNLIENAKKHGFTASDREYEVIFELDTQHDESGESFARIVYKNSGKAFPVGYSFDEYKRLASRAGKTKGSGIGGFFVARVVDLHGGQFNTLSLRTNQMEKYPVQFEILLPLESK